MILTPAILCLTLLCVQDDRRVPGSDELMTDLHFSVVDARHVLLDIKLGNTGQRRLELTMPEGTPFGIGDAGAGLLLAEEVQVVIEPGKIWQKQVQAIPIGTISVTEGVAGPSDLARIESALDQFAGVMELAQQGKITSDPIEVASWILTSDMSTWRDRRSDFIAADTEQLWRDVLETSQQLASHGTRPDVGGEAKPHDTVSSPQAPKVASLSQMLGLTLLETPRELRQRSGIAGGASVVRVKDDSLAARVGIRPGEVIFLCQGDSVTDPQGLDRLLESSLGQSQVTIHLYDEVSSRQVELPLPLYGARYQHVEGGFELPLPAGWFVVRGHRNRVVDPKFDTLISPDGQDIMIVYRSSMPAREGKSRLDAYESEKIAEANRFSQAHSERFRIDGAPAFRVWYRSTETPETVSRVAFYHRQQVFVINCVHPTTQEDKLPAAISHALEQLELSY